MHHRIIAVLVIVFIILMFIIFAAMSNKEEKKTKPKRKRKVTVYVSSETANEISRLTTENNINIDGVSFVDGTGAYVVNNNKKFEKVLSMNNVKFEKKVGVLVNLKPSPGELNNFLANRPVEYIVSMETESDLVVVFQHNKL